MQSYLQMQLLPICLQDAHMLGVKVLANGDSIPSL